MQTLKVNSRRLKSYDGVTRGLPQNSKEIWVREDGMLKNLKINFQSDEGCNYLQRKSMTVCPGTFEETHSQVL